MIRENNAFFLVLVINQKLISYTILAPRKSLSVEMLFLMKRSSGHGTMMVFNNRFLLLLMERMKMKDSSWWRMNSSQLQQLQKKMNDLNMPEEDQHRCRTMRYPELINLKTHSLTLLYFWIVILQFSKMLSKHQNGGRLWMKKLQPSKKMIHRRYLIFQKDTKQLV